MFLDHVRRHTRTSILHQILPFREVIALIQKLQCRSDSGIKKSMRGSEYTWHALRNMCINWEAAGAADRVRERLRSEVVNFGLSRFHGNVQTLVSWGRDLIFFNADIRDPGVAKLLTAAWAHKITSLAISVTPQAGDETDPDALVRRVRRLPNLRKIYLVVSYQGRLDYDSDSDYGDEVKEREVARPKRDLRWDYLFTLACLVRILPRHGSGTIANPRDDFMLDLRPNFTVEGEFQMHQHAKIFLEEQPAEDITDATAFLKRNWVDGLSRSFGGLRREVKVQWVL